ncbi:hypothetical protein KIN20_009145 [Parelaphostrongylus tenuis]|uniref:Uncharacterized protein n=1 Tax=Parelaphostrongylus tenuis TaxID=148309 RepID=A0AAD5M7T2_PARTN|nr:hypothetical protein KIN20_009145 [Parelaphostrongylus tenuis]
MDLTIFFREVEQPSEATSVPTQDIMTAVQPSQKQAAELFKYLGPALFGPTIQTNGEYTAPNEAHSVRKRSWVA